MHEEIAVQSHHAWSRHMRCPQIDEGVSGDQQHCQRQVYLFVQQLGSPYNIAYHSSGPTAQSCLLAKYSVRYVLQMHGQTSSSGLHACKPCLIAAAESFSNWAVTLLLHVPPVTSSDATGVVLNFAEQITLIIFSIGVPFMLFVFIGFVLTIIHQFLVQEWIFAYFGSRLAVWDALKHIALELWYVHRHSGSDDAALVAFLRYFSCLHDVDMAARFHSNITLRLMHFAMAHLAIVQTLL